MECFSFWQYNFPYPEIKKVLRKFENHWYSKGLLKLLYQNLLEQPRGPQHGGSDSRARVQCGHACLLSWCCLPECAPGGVRRKRPLGLLMAVLTCWMTSFSCRTVNLPLFLFSSVQFSSIQSLSRVRLFATPRTAARRPPCPLPTPGVHPNPCPLSR